MHAHEPFVTHGWQARLELAYARRGAASYLAHRKHTGPLVVQKALYPEGEAVCHGIVLHPPAGIAGGDELTLSVGVGEGAHALLTTPGAGKWYRSAGAMARQQLEFELAAGACLEWLPQETIVFDAAQAHMQTHVRLAAGASFIGWELLCLGRTASGERFERGALRLSTRIERAGKLLWREQGGVEGSDPLLASPAGLAGYPVCGTLIAVAEQADSSLVARCRECMPTSGECGVSLLPGLIVARYLGHASEAGRAYFTALWQALRPALLGREAQPPRIWRT